MSSLVAEMLGLLKVSISKTAVLKTELAADLPAIHANAAEIRRVVMNLTLNASESLLGRPGSITVRTARVPMGRADIRLDVLDTGCGMTEDVKAKIFDPIYATQFVGRGLALTTVQGIVRQHGGWIEVESTPGQGSRFSVLYPAPPDNPLRNRLSPQAQS